MVALADWVTICSQYPIGETFQPDSADNVEVWSYWGNIVDVFLPLVLLRFRPMDMGDATSSIYEFPQPTRHGLFNEDWTILRVKLLLVDFVELFGSRLEVFVMKIYGPIGKFLDLTRSLYWNYLWVNWPRLTNGGHRVCPASCALSLSLKLQSTSTPPFPPLWEPHWQWVLSRGIIVVQLLCVYYRWIRGLKTGDSCVHEFIFWIIIFNEIVPLCLDPACCTHGWLRSINEGPDQESPRQGNRYPEDSLNPDSTRGGI